MYFEKGNKKKNHKFAFSTTLVIFLVASVAISASIVPKNAFAQSDPITNCFIANAIVNPAYFQSEQNFVNSLPKDMLFTKLSAEVGN